MALGHMFGRIGCNMFGCCFGKITEASNFCSIQFPAGSPAFEKHKVLGLLTPYSNLSLNVIPTQLIEAGFLGLLAAFLLIYDKKKIRKQSGCIFILYLSMYSLFRFIIEFFRGDYEANFIVFKIITVSQTISIALFITSIILFFKYQKTVKK